MTERELSASVRRSSPHSPVVSTHHTKLDCGHILDSLKRDHLMALRRCAFSGALPGLNASKAHTLFYSSLYSIAYKEETGKLRRLAFVTFEVRLVFYLKTTIYSR